MQAQFACAAGIVFVTLLQVSQATLASSYGTSFRFALMPNEPDASQKGFDRLMITAPLSAATGSVSCPSTGWSQSFSVSLYGTALVHLPSSLRVIRAAENKALYVSASTAVAVYLYSAEVFSGEASIVYPESVLHTTNYILSYTPHFYPSSFVLVAPKTGTSAVTVYTRTGNQWTIHIQVTLQAAQTYYANTSTADYSGFKVESSVPLAVFSGGECLEVPGPPSSNAPLRFYKSGYCDMLLEQMAPPAFWGTTYVPYTNPTRPSAHGDVFRALCASDCSVTLTTSGVMHNSTTGGYVEFQLPSRQEEVISCSEKCLLVMYNKRSLNLQPSFDTDPYMTTVAPVTSWGEVYVVQPTTDYQNRTYVSSYVTLMAHTTDAIEILMDGVTRLNANWRAVPGSPYSVLELSLTSSRAVRFHHPRPGVRFGLYVTGQSKYDTYSYVAGVTSSDLTESTETPKATTASLAWLAAVGALLLLIVTAVILIWYFCVFKKRVTTYEEPEDDKIRPERVLSAASLQSTDDIAREKAKLFVVDPHSFLQRPINHKEIVFIRPKSALKPQELAWLPD